MLGVTGPNEYENNINNNWYTNRMAAWTLEWTLEAHHWLKENAAEALSAITSKTSLNADTEFAKWSAIIAKMYYQNSEKLGVVLQQDGFLDKEQLTADDLRAPHCYLKRVDRLPRRRDTRLHRQCS